MSTRFIISALLIAATLQSHAADIKCQAGTLASTVGNDAKNIETLTVSGQIDASDMHFLATEMPKLRSLDISQCTIAAYRGTSLNGATDYAAGLIPQGFFAGTKLSAVKLPALEALSIGDAAFAASDITEIVLPANTRSLGQGAFAACKALTKAVLTQDVQSTGYTFRDCPALVEVDLAGVKSVAQRDFAGCSKLNEIRGTQNLTEIRSYAFAGNKALESFDFGPALTSIGDHAFEGDALAEVDIQSGLKNIGKFAFADNRYLIAVILPPSTETIGEGAFFDCPALTEFIIPQGCDEIAPYMLKDAESLDNINLGNAVSIGCYALKGAGIESLSLPATIDKIDTGAMESMDKLAEIDAKALKNVPRLGNDVWADVPVQGVSLYVDQKLEEAFKNAAQWQEFDIHPTNVGVEGVTATNTALRGVYTAEALLLEAEGTEIADVKIYNIAGTMLATSQPAAARCAVAADNWDADIIVITCSLADGSSASLKLAR